MQVDPNRVLDVDKIPSESFTALKKVHRTPYAELMKKMEGDGGHPTLMGFLGTVDIKITQSEDLGLSLRQKTANVIVEGKFGETVNVEGIF